MIDAKELRIGNVISVGDLKTGATTMMRGAKTIFDVCAITQSQIHIHQINNMGFGTIALSEAEGIPLTEEILLKCGFEGIKETYLYSRREDKGEDGDICVFGEDGKYSLYIFAADDSYSYIGIDITSVHQLQNLYFALTGKELEIIW
jgi:hypothetical protein